ncbi:ferritin-like domain-containing protein [Mycetohabitans sp. B46]|uniref:ferritin-like domain-containing protein n=1 Tax=Mycetohabitans sp. B46 TaxID=2772536 RepID=UPI00307CE31B
MILLEQRSILKDLQTAQPVSAICSVLQRAIELEHATIPPYLYALYSLDASKNKEIADILLSVVMEEMLHMTLASNVLNALGGNPDIGHPNFIPKYPGPLPGGVQGGLEVHLAPFSLKQLDTFLTIEEPETPLDYPSLMALFAKLGKPEFFAEPSQPITIGQFYEIIKIFIELMGDSVFVKPPRNQVGPDLMKGSIVVTNVKTAKLAIETIIQQGEGTRNSPDEPGENGYAHYYRFMQIKKGRQLLKNSSPPPPYSYSGNLIQFDPQGVYNVPTDPKAANYPPGSAQQLACNNFNYAYTNLLTALNKLVNGHATPEQFNIAIGLMMSLKGQAKNMMAGIPNPEVVTGPSFEYQLVDPGNGI